MDLKEIGWDGVEWIHVAHVRWGPVAGFCGHGNEPSRSTKDVEYFDQLSDC
jgi:hypothetical protein